ncbi:MAG: HEAT repeat domain-containing protein [Cyclobacteriaceae bacterium]
MPPKTIYGYIIFLIAISLSGCSTSRDNPATNLEDVAANEEVARYMQSFEGRGALADNSQPTAPQDALTSFRYPDDLALDLVLSEPMVHQPLDLSFDHRGRMWVVQYNQYPYPEGLKVTSIDNHLRVKFDKTLEPPPAGTPGADKITIFEDTNGDGTYDQATDAITGLNIATSVTLGRGRIWVLSPPYLLAYPDGDGLPDGEPVVHLEGFGLEDTHAVANSLRWGPDGWLYGAQGSTTTAKINSSVSKNVSFQGQAIWRYHPKSHIFEIFAEGGGNTFDIEIDAKGRIYSGDNGTDRGQYYKQGGYYVKNWGKHGALTNPYAFGYLPNMDLDGDKKRFTHAWIKYEGGSLPEHYQGKMIAINPLQSYVQLTRLEPTGSTFANVDEERILETDDHWFRPVDIKTGPDGAIYLADWYDSRLSHVDPRDTWHKSSGRIYRLHSKDHKISVPAFDLSTYSDEQLIEVLSHPNKWFRQQALRQFGDRNHPSAIPQLRQLLTSKTGQVALEALWALNLSGGFSDSVAITALQHPDPFVRMWGVRLLGDDLAVSSATSAQLAQLAFREPHPEVRSQLACTAKRLPGSDAIPIIKNLLMNHNDADDPDIPLLIWWALESKVESDREAVLGMFEEDGLWEQTTVQETILGRLMQRYIMAGGSKNSTIAARLLAMAPSPTQARVLMNGLQEGLRGRDVAELSPALVKALQPYQDIFKEESLVLALRQGQSSAITKALAIMADEQAPIGQRLAYIRIMGEINQPEAVPVLLKIMESNQSSGALRQAALQALPRYNTAEIGERVVKAYPNKLRADPDVRMAALALFATRSSWAHQLLDAIDGKKEITRTSIARTISQDDVPEPIVRRLALLGDPAIDTAAERLWPGVRAATSTEKNERMTQVSQLLKSGSGNPSVGHSIYQNRCGSCHRLFDEGGNIGPDLTGYDRSNIDDLLLNIVDPNADIREGYVNYHITTQDDRTLVGTLVNRSDETITLQPPVGDVITLSTDQIKDLQAQSVSLMPERLLEGMTDQQVRDLFSYLTEAN